MNWVIKVYNLQSCDNRSNKHCTYLTLLQVLSHTFIICSVSPWSTVFDEILCTGHTMRAQFPISPREEKTLREDRECPLMFFAIARILLLKRKGRSHIFFFFYLYPNYWFCNAINYLDTCNCRNAKCIIHIYRIHQR